MAHQRAVTYTFVICVNCSVAIVPTNIPSNGIVFSFDPYAYKFMSGGCMSGFGVSNVGSSMTFTEAPESPTIFVGTPLS